MTENEESQNAESVETVATQEVPSTESTETTQPTEEEQSQEQALPWPPAGVEGEVQELVETLVGKFFPALPLSDLVESEARRLKAALPVEVSDIIVSATKHKEMSDPDWALRAKHIFHSNYPSIEREVWSNGRICQKRYPRTRQDSGHPVTYSVASLSPIREPKNNLGAKIAPYLYFVQENNEGGAKVVPTSEAERFFNGERLAVPKSSLSEVVIHNRPSWGVRHGWQEYKKGFLPKRVETAKLVSNEVDTDFIDSFIYDLRTTFSWENGEQLPKYLGMLLQPMIAHLTPGQNPAYAILGPTKSGKGYLSSVLPALLYSRIGEPTVLVKKMPNSTYEMEVFLASCSEALFLCLDEVKNASDEEFKMIDAMCTQETLQARVMRQGYHEIPNLITICMTAVHQNFTDETYGRLALIKLTESRSEQVANFHARWKKYGPELLSGIFARVRAVEYNPTEVPRVADRRPGFSTVAHFVETVFQARPDYSIESTTNDVLDDLCRMYEESNLGTKKGQWQRYTTANFVSFMSEQYDRRWKRSSAAAAINTALGYRSTVNHPNYKDAGYPAESGKFYHFEVREEGIKTKRSFIYIREVTHGNP